MATSADLLHALGDLKERLGRMEGQLEGVVHEQQNSALSRRGMHERLEAVNGELHRLSFTAEAQAGIQAQTREVLKELAGVQGTIAKNVQPLLDLHPDIASVVELYTDIKKARARWRWAATVFGGALILIAGFMGEQIRQDVAAWLALPPT